MPELPTFLDSCSILRSILHLKDNLEKNKNWKLSQRITPFTLPQTSVSYKHSNQVMIFSSIIHLKLLPYSCRMFRTSLLLTERKISEKKKKNANTVAREKRKIKKNRRQTKSTGNKTIRRKWK